MSNTQPNVIILYADDLGFGDLSCYGANDIPTPNLDQLAAEGLKFDQAYATAATCTPSRYSLLTGSYPGAILMLRCYPVMPRKSLPVTMLL
ncbi:TPA: sulfatase [Vibrio cholerae]